MAYFVTFQNAKSVVLKDILKNYELILVPPKKKQQHVRDNVKGRSSIFHRIILSFLIFPWLAGLNIKDTARWSVIIVKCFPAMRSLHLQTHSTMAYATFSTIWSCVSERFNDQEKNATGLQACKRVPPIAFTEASVSIPNGNSSLITFTENSAMSFLSPSKEFTTIGGIRNCLFSTSGQILDE